MARANKINIDGSCFEGIYEDNIPADGHYKWADGMEYKG